MKFWLTFLFVTLFCMSGWAQSDPSIPADDNEFNLFLLVLAIAFFSIIIGAVLVGSILVLLLLFAVLALISAGILSAGVLVGLYRRSLTAGFRTVLLLICGLGGSLAGTICFWLINRVFAIHLTAPTAALIGAFSGLLGGILLGLALAGIIRIFLEYCRQKLSF